VEEGAGEGLREREEVERGGDREGSAREGCVTVVRGDAFLALETMWGRGWVYAAGHSVLLGAGGRRHGARESSLVLLAASLRWRAFAAIRHDASERASERGRNVSGGASEECYIMCEGSAGGPAGL